MEMSAPATVSVGIDQMVVEGLAWPEARQLALAFQDELRRLIERRGVPAGLLEESDTAALALDEIAVAPEVSPRRLGAELAAAVYRELDR